MDWIFAVISVLLFGVVLLQRELLHNVHQGYEDEFVKNCRLNALVKWLEEELKNQKK